MLKCTQCHASTPDECARRHAAQLELHRAIDTERAAMHREIDGVADSLIRSAQIMVENDDALPGMRRSDVEHAVARYDLVTAGLNIFGISREISQMIQAWKE